jgi:hypothetical protein
MVVLTMASHLAGRAKVEQHRAQGGDVTLAFATQRIVADQSGNVVVANGRKVFVQTANSASTTEVHGAAVTSG